MIARSWDSLPSNTLQYIHCLTFQVLNKKLDPSTHLRTSWTPVGRPVDGGIASALVESMVCVSHYSLHAALPPQSYTTSPDSLGIFHIRQEFIGYCDGGNHGDQDCCDGHQLPECWVPAKGRPTIAARTAINLIQIAHRIWLGFQQ